MITGVSEPAVFAVELQIDFQYHCWFEATSVRAGRVRLRETTPGVWAGVVFRRKQQWGPGSSAKSPESALAPPIYGYSAISPFLERRWYSEASTIAQRS